MPTHFDPDKNPEDDRFQPKPDGSHDNLGGHSDDEEKKFQDSKDSNPDLADKEGSSSEGGFYKPEGDKTERGALAKAKAGDMLNTASQSWVRGDSTSKNIRRFVGNSFLRKKGIPIGGGLFGGIVILVFIFFSFFSTYKTAHIIENIEQQVGKVPEYAIERRLEYYMNRYLISRQLAKMGIPEGDIKERYVYLGNSPFETLYNNWRGANLEGKLESEYGVRLRSDIPGLDEGKIFNRRYTLPSSWTLELTGAGKADPNLAGRKLNSLEVREFIKEFTRNETRSIQMIKRYNMRKVLKKYYGINGWKQYVYDRNDTYREKTDRYREGKKNFKKKVVDSTIGKMNASWGEYMKCLMDGATKDVCTETRKASNSGESLIDESELDNLVTEAEEKVATEAAEATTKEVDDIVAREVGEKLSKVGVKKFATAAIPVAGWVAAASDITNAVNSGVLSQVVYAKNAAQYGGFAAPFLSGSDQCRSGIDIDSDDCRVLNETFTDYEKSQLYQNQKTKQSGTGKFTGQKIKQDCNNDGATNDPEDFVRDNDPLCAGKKVMQDRESFTNSEAWQVWSHIGKATDNEVVAALRGAFDKAMELSGVSGAIGILVEKSGAGQALAAGFEFILARIAAPVITGNEVGPAAFDALWGGMSVIKSSIGGAVGENREDTIGGIPLTTKQVAQIRAEQYQDRQYELSRESTIARYFSPDIPESLTSQAIMATPSSASGVATTFSTLLNPATYFNDTIANFTADAGAQAAEETENPFGILEYGIPPEHEIFTANDGAGMEHDALQKEYDCAKPAAERPQNNLDSYSDYDGAMPFKVPTEVDPCQLETFVEDAGSRWFSKTYDEGIEDGAVASSAGTTGVTVPGGLAWPMPHEGSYVTSCYGMRDSGMHRGTDISTGAGTAPISAIADGEVVQAGPADGYGPNYVVIKHANNVHSAYGHMRSMSVTVGQQVKQAEQIGVEGNEGNSRGAHLHLNLYKDGDLSYNAGVDALANGLEVPDGVGITGGNCGEHR